jgi:hypothetical protein
MYTEKEEKKSVPCLHNSILFSEGKKRKRKWKCCCKVRSGVDITNSGKKSLMDMKTVNALIDEVKVLKRIIMHNVVIEEGREYEYVGGIPQGCKGHRYRVDGFVLSVPVYQIGVLVKALTGADAGLSIVCTPANFSLRYKPLQAG